jgi:hypothetical protein
MTTPHSTKKAGWLPSERDRTRQKPPPHGEARPEAEPEPSTPAWPAALQDQAYFGLAGEWVRAVAPHTEADSAALLIQLLVSFGNMIGRGPYSVADGASHYTNLNVALVGRTSKARKGTAWANVESVLRHVEQDWCSAHVVSGMSTGEGLIWAVRDPIVTRTPVREGGKRSGAIIGYTDEITDEGIQDKRLLVIEPEFASVLQRAEIKTNTLSAVIRDAFDKYNLRTLTKNSPARASGAMISIVAHITREELRSTLTQTQQANGFANRFMWFCAARSKALPYGGAIDTVDMASFGKRIAGAVEFAKKIGRIEHDQTARPCWEWVYRELSEGKPGLFGACIGRAEAITLRLAMLYALLDSRSAVNRDHLEAALALWNYAEDSAKYIFGDAVGDPLCDEILAALKGRTEGMTRTGISELFNRNRRSEDISRALSSLAEQGKVRRETAIGEGPGKRPERWFVI